MALAADAHLLAQSKGFDPTINEKNTLLLLLLMLYDDDDDNINNKN
jgi:hypothetical protein